jgi:hypothetical protein
MGIVSVAVLGSSLPIEQFWEHHTQLLVFMKRLSLFTDGTDGKSSSAWVPSPYDPKRKQAPASLTRK